MKITGIKMNIDPADKILLKRHLNNNGKAQLFFTNEVRRLSIPYVPALTRKMEQTAVVQPKSITYGQPYARRQYYENKGLNRSKAPLAGSLWDKRMWADRGPEIVSAVANFTGGRNG